MARERPKVRPSELLRLWGLAAILPLVELFQFGSAGRVLNHFFCVVRKPPHDLKQFPLPPHRSVHVDSGQKHSEAIITALLYLSLQPPQTVDRLGMWRLANHRMSSIADRIAENISLVQSYFVIAQR